MSNRKHIPPAPLLLLLLFLAYQASATMFGHAHVVNGVRVVHSHPSSKKQTHTHTQGQVVTIACVASFQGVAPEAPWTMAPECPAPYVPGCSADTSHVLPPHTQGIRLRAPPFSCCL